MSPCCSAKKATSCSSPYEQLDTCCAQPNSVPTSSAGCWGPAKVPGKQDKDRSCGTLSNAGERSCCKKVQMSSERDQDGSCGTSATAAKEQGCCSRRLDSSPQMSTHADDTLAKIPVAQADSCCSGGDPTGTTKCCDDKPESNDGSGCCDAPGGSGTTSTADAAYCEGTSKQVSDDCCYAEPQYDPVYCDTQVQTGEEDCCTSQSRTGGSGTCCDEGSNEAEKNRCRNSELRQRRSTSNNARKQVRRTSESPPPQRRPGRETDMGVKDETICPCCVKSMLSTDLISKSTLPSSFQARLTARLGCGPIPSYRCARTIQAMLYRFCRSLLRQVPLLGWVLRD
jgi:hypothetical protein